MINFLNLEYFLVAAEELNFTRAAKKTVYFTAIPEQPHLQPGKRI
jgi:hypothetical protein